MFPALVSPLGSYARWLHLRWPAGTVEKLPEVGSDGQTNVPGIRVVGDLSGIPLLKFAADTGARAVQAFVAEKDFAPSRQPDDPVADVAIVGGGIAGLSAALEARRQGLRYVLFEASEPFSTIVNFPRGKPIFTYPTDFKPAGDLTLGAAVKEDLVAELEAQRRAAGIEPRKVRIEKVERRDGLFQLHHKEGEPFRARRVVVAIGRSGNFRKLGVRGEHLDKVYNRLHDPRDYAGQNVVVVGGGDSAMEAAIALTLCGAQVVLAYRGKEFSRPKPENLEKLRQLQADPAARVQVEQPTSERVTTAAMPEMRGDRPPGRLEVRMETQVAEITPTTIALKDAKGAVDTRPNDVVFAMIGREPPLDFFRRSGIRIRGEWSRGTWAGFIGFFLLCLWVYSWKAQYIWPGAAFGIGFPSFLDPNPETWIGALQGLGGALGAAASDPSTLLGTLAVSASSRGFYYTLLYTLLIVVFGLRRIRRRGTPYVTRQTFSLMSIQVVPLFLLPEIVLPLLGHNGVFDGGALRWVADQLFPLANYGHGREYWRAYGFILAWPLMVQNVFSPSPMALWLVIACLQTFVLIPLLIRRWGKGAYCGWICSCGAMAETLGDNHRHKMLHGPRWNRLNLVGQVILALAFLLLLLRVFGWMGAGWAAGLFDQVSSKVPFLNYAWTVDLLLAGAIGYGFYFWFSGRVWCRFACPLAALMHIYARFSRFRIFADKKKCISCNVCTSVCHQGIDIMNFANKGLPMEDPECVRCSACVQQCPTGVLTFGYIRGDGSIAFDKLAASRVQMAEKAAH